MPKPKRDRFDEMLSNWRTLLPLFRDKWGRSNCPLTAEAVWRYFETGKIERAPALLSGATQMAQCGDVRPIKRNEIGLSQGSCRLNRSISAAPSTPC